MAKKQSKKPGKKESGAAAPTSDAETKAEAVDSTATAKQTKSAETPALVTKIERLDNAIGLAEHGFLAIVLFSLIGVGSYQFLASRLFHVNDTWPFEALRYLVFFCAMGGAALASQKGRMISMDFVARKLPPRGRIVLRIATSTFVVVACYLLYRGGMGVREAVAGEEYEVIKPSTAFLALPLGGLLIGLHYVLHSLTDAIYLANGQIPPEEEGPQAH